jgi:hypothetical protein
MATIGRAFGFYIKYWQEMEAFYEDEAPLGPSSKEDMLEMIEKVGDRACTQAADLLTACGNEIDKYFSETLGCQSKVRCQYRTMRNEWYNIVRLAPSRSRKSNNLFWTTGAFITDSNDDRGPAMFLYIWAGGRNGQRQRQAAEELANLLAKKSVKGADMALGAVAFGRISLREKVGKRTFDIEKEGIVNEVKGLLKKIHKKDVDTLFEI